jgi:phosphomannomutase
MSDAPLMIGVSGLRGIVGESLTPEVAVRYAQVFGSWVQETYGADSAVAIGADGRAGHEIVKQAVIAGLLGSGLYVYDVGVQMTPTLGLAADALLEPSTGCSKNVVAAAVITASHNPQEWNGVKWLISDRLELPVDKLSPTTSFQEMANLAWEITKNRTDDPTINGMFAPSASIANEIVDRFYKHDVANSNQTVKTVVVDGIEDYHIKRVEHALLGWAGLDINPVDQRTHEILQCIGKLAVVVDSVNSSGSKVVQKFSNKSGFRYIQLHGDDTGIFPHTPEPTEENLSGEGGLCDAVPGLNADVGFAQDPDGDRLAIVDENGKYIGEEFTFVLCAVSVLEAMKEKDEFGDDVVLCTNLSTSRMIDDVADKYGARVVRTAVGEANVVEAMKGLKREGKEVVLGGEGNGGVIWPMVTYVRDSLGSMALVLSLMARTGKTVSELVADVPSYAIVKRKQPLAKKDDAQPTIERLAQHYKDERVDRQDGVRIDFDEARAWVHVRASNTEPILRLIGEAPNAGAAEALLDEVQRIVDAG